MQKVNIYEDNLGGISKIIVINPDSVSRVIRNEVTKKNFLVLKNRNSIFEIITDDDFEFNEVETETDEGISYNSTIEGFISKIDKEKSCILDELVLGRWLVVHQDRNGEIWLSGTKEYPMSFSYSRKSGKNPNDRNSASFVFSAVQIEQSIRIEDTYI